MRQLPYSSDAEVAILGTLLVFPDAISQAYENNLSVSDFYMPEHQKIFTHMLEIADVGRLLDATTLLTRLKDHHEVEAVGGVDYLFHLTSNAAAESSLKHYIGVVQEKSQTRRLIEAAQLILDKGFDTSTENAVLLDLAEKTILEVTQDRRTSEMQNSTDVVNEFLENLARIQKNRDRITGLRTGFNSLNSVTNGLQRGDLIILAARPSVGKTAFALNVGLNVARHNNEGQATVAFFSLEMPATHLMARLLASQSSVKSEFLRSGSLTNEQMNDLNVAAGILKGCNIFIDDSSTITTPEIFSKCRKLKAEHGLDIIIIDYIQLITGRGNGDNRQQEVSEISRSLKQLAREMNVPVIALSQLSRNVEKRDNKVPQLSDLRESGSIEQDADIVMFLYREDYYKNTHGTDEEPDQREEPKEVQEVLVKISKHRNGALAELNLAFNASLTKFYDYDVKERG